MYKDVIKVDANDPLLSATSLEGTVIGILFEKSGEEIKSAIAKRISLIDKEIQKKSDMISPIRDFLMEKTRLISEIEVYENDRDVEKTEKLKPLNKKLEDMRDAIKQVENDLRSESKDFDSKTMKQLRSELKVFNNGWEEIDSKLVDLEKKHEEETWKFLENMTPATSTGGAATFTYGLSSSSSSNSTSSVNWKTARGEIAVDSPKIAFKLRQKIDEYKSMFDIIKEKIKNLEMEKRRLNIISRNISSDRKFKLSLVQLSSFGFEDLEVQ